MVSADAKKAFDRNPEKYIPAYGGWCAFGMSVSDKFPVDPTNFKIVDGRLMLFPLYGPGDYRSLYPTDRRDSSVGGRPHFLPRGREVSRRDALPAAFNFQDTLSLVSFYRFYSKCMPKTVHVQIGDSGTLIIYTKPRGPRSPNHFRRVAHAAVSSGTWGQLCLLGVVEEPFGCLVGQKIG